MAKDLNSVFNAVSANRTTAEEDSVRSIASSPLASGVPVGVGTSLISGPAQNQTTRLFAGGGQSTTGGNQGDREQVLPSTDNKVPRIYGQVTTGGVVTDVHKANANTIFVCFTISELNTDEFDQRNGTFQDAPVELLDVYRNDQQATFRTGATDEDSQIYYLTDINDANACVDIRTANVLNVWAWAGNSHSNAMIWPEVTPSPYSMNAYDIFPTWDANVTMDNTLFAIVQVDRLNEDLDATANIEIEEVGDWRFTVNTLGKQDVNDPSSIDRLLHNPAVALQDYLINDVYGCGLANADLDLTAFDSWREYCAENILYASRVLRPGGVSKTFPDGSSGYINSAPNRRRVDAFINTQQPVIENINQICQAGSATFSYDAKQGKFTVLINKPITDGEKANAFVFNNTNIISAISVNSTDLYSLYNFNEVTFPNYLQQDRADSLLVEIPVADRVTNEPTSGTNYSISAITDRFRAADLANISLKQSRINNTITFSADHSSMGVTVGDFAKVTDSGKGFDEKIVRVMRVNEREQEDGTLVFDYVCTEYSDHPFEEMIYLDTTGDPVGGAFGTVENYLYFGTLDSADFFENYQIPFGTAGGASTDVGNVYVVNETDTGNGNVYLYDGTLAQANANAQSMRSQTLVPISIDASNNPWLGIKGSANIAEYGTAATAWDDQYITLTNQNPDPDGSPALNSITVKYNLPGTDAQNYGWFPLNKLTSGVYTVSLQYENPDRYPARLSLISTTGNITISDLDCDTPTVTGLDDTTYGKGTQLVDDYSFTPAVHTTLTSNLPRQFDVCNIVQAEFEVSTNINVNWTSVSSPSSNYLQVAPTMSLTYESKSNADSQTFELPLPGIDFITNASTSGIKGTWTNTSTTINTTPSHYGLDDDWYVARMHTDVLDKNSGLSGFIINGGLFLTHVPHNYRYKL